MFDFVNVNPLQKREEDCVTRAITLATQEDYYKIQEKLKLIAQLYECDTLCVCCYKHLLDKFYCFPRVHGYEGIRVKDLCHYLRYGTYIVRVEGHLTCIIDGKIEDTWDCGDEIVDVVWRA